ncbi:tRNA (adenosine(37)-N6)-threonylcarbamoyltransferase complex dimerization subunit type 1 TsaB [Sediminibacterium goheungense]|uniref:tRNA threonylcarbamoyladenosine biosynthesis protein TsaB n=1 Tax=Sediminibacterium goheungense TaxID=1086393 RepID=A0A4R6J176_9BACT|nr:tRNA (adenosine(37)-N6)-threonylcarbamoyltransferase complex dimerization subunit type 1 TsaB [Sediminibacterium goheungense]TDO28992.1 tRNA threonylcarbamoyladenosine biosynthesis protein TsaB [Sediminibacterium goheungense]
MSYILNIDTATETAGVCLSHDQAILAQLSNTDQKNHAAFIQPAIASIMQETDLNLTDIDAVAVTAGPGSYTGLRVGMATAKGICFALDKPLITINTLEVMALAAIESADNEVTAFCPLIDARRMEVFTAIYDHSLTMLLEPQAMVLEEQSFADFLDKNIMLFSGSGMKKLSKISGHPNARFTEVQHHAAQLAKLALKAFSNKHFADLAYSEPLYLKPFFDTSKK